MVNELEKAGLKHLKRIEQELEEIKDRTANPRRAFIYGIAYGAGAFVGGILAVALIGWLLNIFGIIPGLSVIGEYLQSLVDQIPGRM